VTFGDMANLSGAKFFGFLDLSAQSKDDWRKQVSKLPTVYTTIQSWTPKRQQQFWDAHLNLHQTGAGPDAFRRVSFSRAHFMGIAKFSGRNFFARCDLTNAWFYQPPTFHECKATGHIDLYGTRILVFRRRNFPGWTTNSDVVIRLRALRKLADETGNHDLERDLYIEERKAERGIVLAEYWREGKIVLLKPKFLAHCLWIALMGGYWLLADYGRSIMRPLLALAVSIVVFHASYSWVLTSPSATDKANFNRAVWAFAIANAVPFVGALTIEKEVKGLILCAGAAPDTSAAMKDNKPTCLPVPTVGFQALALGQSIISGLLIFFIALALRNYFRLR
jgi:hypothetical protein